MEMSFLLAYMHFTVYIYDALHALIDNFIQRMYVLLLQKHDLITEKDLQIN